MTDRDRTTSIGAAVGLFRRLLPAGGSGRSSMVRVVAHQVILFVALMLVAIQVVIFTVIGSAIYDNALQKIHEEIQVGERIFERLLEERSQQLIVAASILTADFAFREALTSGDNATVVSALRNHGARIAAEKIVLIGSDHAVLADASAPDGDSRAAAPVYAELVAGATEGESAAAIRLIDGLPYQLVAVPVLAPVPVGWVVLGFPIDGRLASDLGALTALEVSFATRRPGGAWQLAGTNLNPDARAALLELIGHNMPALASEKLIERPDGAYVVSFSKLHEGTHGQVVGILQRSLAEAVARFSGVRMTLLVLACLSLGATFVGSILIARSISRPVTALAEFARRLEHGDYEHGPPQARADELGELATAFNNMRLAIAAREQQIKAMAYHDALTGLPNRSLFTDRLNQAIGMAKRMNHPMSVMLIDLNRFKEVNDTLGHHVGDLLLREVGSRLRGALARASDTVARLGGDEFAVLLPAATSDMAHEAAHRLLRALADPVAFEGRLLDVEGSIGIASYPVHADDPHVLMSRADAAMYYAKRRRLGVAAYDPRLRMAPKMDARLSLSAELRQALERNEFFLCYQPRVGLSDGQVRGVEALLRWKHPLRGVLAPDDFIPFAEQTGIIRDITTWVVNAAMADSLQWQAADVRLDISINLSARDLLDPAFAGRLRELLAVRGLSPSRLQFEFTESALIDDPARALATAQELSDMGFRLAIDAFGTGYSSLLLVCKLPVAELKIDRSLVMTMDANADDRTIVRTIIDLAHNLGLVVVGEGVESERLRQLLAAMHCDVVQGYHFCEPVVAAALLEWLAERRAAAGK